MAQEGQLYAMELQGKALCMVWAAWGGGSCLHCHPLHWGPSLWLCPCRLLDGHRAAKRLPHRHVHVPAGAACTASREAVLGARCRRERAGGKCQPPARRPPARVTGFLRPPTTIFATILKLCPPVPTLAK